MLVTLLLIALILEGLIFFVLMRKMRKPRYDGRLILTETEKKMTFTFDVNTDPEQWLKKDHIVLQVSNAPE